MAKATSPRMTSPRILCIGMPVRDLVYRIKNLPLRGHKEHASHFSEVSGGNALNASIGITRLGGRVLFSGPMGDASEKGTGYIFDDLAKETIDGSGIVRVNGAVTPISNIMIDPSGERTIVTFRDPTLWKVKLPDADVLLNDCAAVLTENRCADFVTGLCVEARRRGIPVILDADQPMSLREGLLTASSHLIFSMDALRATAGVEGAAAGLRRIASLTPGFLAVTSGSQGMTWLGADKSEHHMPSFPVHTVDTLGAGDIFHGAFTLAIAEGMDVPQAMRFSAAAAAIKCTRFGGAFAAPTREEVETLLKSAAPPQDTAGGPLNVAG